MLNPSLRNIHFFCYRKVSVLSIYPHRCKCSTDEHHAAACCCWTNTFSSSCFHKHHVCSQSVKKQSQFNASFLRSRNLATTSVDENATLLWSSRMVPLIGSVWFRQRSRGKFMSVVSLCGHCDASHMPAMDSRGFCLLAGRTVAFRLHTQLLWHLSHRMQVKRHRDLYDRWPRSSWVSSTMNRRESCVCGRNDFEANHG